MDLYTLDAEPAAFRRLCGGNQQEDDQEPLRSVGIPG